MDGENSPLKIHNSEGCTFACLKTYCGTLCSTVVKCRVLHFFNSFSFSVFFVIFSFLNIFVKVSRFSRVCKVFQKSSSSSSNIHTYSQYINTEKHSPRALGDKRYCICKFKFTPSGICNKTLGHI